MSIAAAALAWTSLSGAPAAVAQPRRLLPVDEGRRDPSWVTFRARLERALKERDVPFVLGILDPEIRNSFGEDAGGVERFKTVWTLVRAPASPLWKALGDVLALGGTFRPDGAFCAPYTFARFPDDIDSSDHAVIIRRDAPLYAGPSASARVLSRLFYDIVELDPSRDVIDARGERWARVTTPSGRRGYVRDADLRSPLDYRACFKRSADGWRMRSLAAGD